MRLGVLRVLAVLLGIAGVAGCSGGGSSPSTSAALAAQGRAALVSTFNDTSLRLRPAKGPCPGQAGTIATDPIGVACSLTTPIMTTLMRHLDEGLGSGVTSAERQCINSRVTRNQVAALLSGEFDTGQPQAAEKAFEAQLSRIITECRAH